MTTRGSRIPTRLGIFAAGGMLALAACSGSGSSGAGAAAGATDTAPASGAASEAATGAVTIATGTSASLGTYLTGANGMTLYVFLEDSSGKSACTGGCATNWPPLTVTGGAMPTEGSGVTGTLATITRSDGSVQATYDGRPVYYFAGDKAPGDTNGEGLKGAWFVATPSGALPSGAPAGAGSSAAPVPTGSGSSAPTY